MRFFESYFSISKTQNVFREGMAVKGRILMVDSEKEKMTIVIGEKTAESKSKKNKKEEKVCLFVLQ